MPEAKSDWDKSGLWPEFLGVSMAVADINGYQTMAYALALAAVSGVVWATGRYLLRAW